MSSDNHKIIFIGPMGGGGIPTNGVSIRNYHIVNKLRDYTGKLIVVDTEFWKKNPFVLFRLLGVILFNPKTRYLLSLNSMSAYRLISVINGLPGNRYVVYWAAGGEFADLIKEKRVSRKPYRVVDKFLLQGETMVKTMAECGFSNTVYVPNFKRISYIPEKGEKDSILRFVFISRINPHKGCNYILSAARRLNGKYQNRYLIDFYGDVAPEYPDFLDQVNSIPNVNYKGYLDMLDNRNYNVLAQYDAMLFPTYWDGEGFPGVVVDAFVAGLPVIASDWHLNKEIVKDGETGFIIKPQDEDSLYSVMEKCIENPEILRTMASVCQCEAQKYDIDNVLTDDLFKSIGFERMS